MERLPDESYEDYVMRRKAMKIATKIFKLGYSMTFEEHLIYQQYVKQNEGRRNKKSGGTRD